MKQKIKKTKQQFNFAFLGTSRFSVVILDELEKAGLLPSIIVTVPDRPKGRKMIITPPESKVWAEKRDIKVLQPENLEVELPSLLGSSTSKWDLFIVASYGKIIPKSVLDIPIHGTLNVHPSLLPKYRGASPIESQILNDEKNIGVSIMLIDEEMDHGPIIDQKIIEVSDWPIRAVELENLFAHEGGKLLCEIIPNWISGNIDPQEQDHFLATFTKKNEKKDFEINLNDDAYKNYLKILTYPKPFFFENGKRIIITDAKFEDSKLKILRVIPEGKKETDYKNLIS